jgi:hypothetical protein
MSTAHLTLAEQASMTSCRRNGLPHAQKVSRRADFIARQDTMSPPVVKKLTKLDRLDAYFKATEQKKRLEDGADEVFERTQEQVNLLHQLRVSFYS